LTPFGGSGLRALYAIADSIGRFKPMLESGAFGMSIFAIVVHSTAG
jgi:hypothetical protein